LGSSVLSRKSRGWSSLVIAAFSFYLDFGLSFPNPTAAEKPALFEFMIFFAFVIVIINLILFAWPG